MTDLEIRRGDTNEITLVVTAPDANGVAQPVNLTSCLLWFTIKRDWEDTDLSAVVIKTIGSGITVTAPPTAGLAVAKLDPVDTSALVGLQRLVYDVQLREADGTITTVASGYVQVTRDATRATV